MDPIRYAEVCRLRKCSSLCEAQADANAYAQKITTRRIAKLRIKSHHIAAVIYIARLNLTMLRH